ncbi:MAG TPA: alanine--glyoxylate aminotransferase family protein [Thermoplasmata archaeon]|jgi:aspartate aminotransferase-like enzyme|nr:alanine--glyoxylate aminotransferase family protein [Thermoplasmata archaeon]
MEPVFMLPGPVKIDPRVLAAMSGSVVNHRGAAFRKVNADLRDGLRYVFQTKTGEVAAISGSGTAGLESVVSSLLGKSDRVLCLVNGKFSERGFELANLFANPTQIEFPWGKPMDLAKVAAALESGGYRALTICHNETSTAVTNPLKEVAALCRKHDVLCLVDGITSVGGLEVRPDEWGLDAVVLGSQKCIAAPAGLAGVFVSKRAYEQLHEESAYYLNLKEHVDLLKDDEDTPYTPSIPLFLAVREALRLLQEEGLETRIRRTAQLADSCRAAAKAIGLSLYPEESVASNTVTAMNVPPGVDDAKFRKALLEKHGVVVAGGQSQLKGKIFRIGHMGICSMGDMRATWAAIESVLAGMGHKAQAGAAVGQVAARM